MPETRTALINLNEQGLVSVRIRDGAHQSVEDAKVNLSMALVETGGRRRPLLVDIRGARLLDAAARHQYSGQTLADHFSAMALLVEGSPLGCMMGNVYLRVTRPPIPTHLFTDESQAVSWLISHRV
jgi:hypothetical protein